MLRAAHTRLDRATGSGVEAGGDMAQLARGLSEELGRLRQPYLSLGDVAPASGWYEVFHQPRCRMVQTMFVEAAQPLQECSGCGEGVLYRLSFASSATPCPDRQGNRM